MKWKETFSNYGVWVALFAQFTVFYQSLPVLGIPVPTLDMDALGVAIFAIINVLVVLGVVNNPTKGKWFTEKE